MAAGTQHTDTALLDAVMQLPRQLATPTPAQRTRNLLAGSASDVNAMFGMQDRQAASQLAIPPIGHGLAV